MTTETALPAVLEALETATTSAQRLLPSADSIRPPKNGISLFDTKNEIFLSYLQALALRNLNIIRTIKAGGNFDAAQKISDEITKKLVEHRVYLEKGVKPLEQKLKYQVDKAVKTAEDAERAIAQKEKQAAATNGHARKSSDGDSEESGEEGSDEESDGDAESGAEMNENHAPQVGSMMKAKGAADSERRTRINEDGVYRPPRISATAMPTTDKREKKERRPGRSATLDEYVSTELSTAPLAQPSIGSNLAAGGRQSKSARQLREEAERRNYEETNLVRLPAMSKKEMARKGLGKARDGGFGGEEWRGLGESLDRIGDLTKRKGKDSALDKSRKRRAVEDGPRGDGIGNSFDIKRRRMQKKGQI
ncbi:related to RNA binding LCP5 [Lecanosticta acicola]|uniref:Related to RNA binding LCP5 n=1 Tax=Lecanosticta acicola TaxID=111012 RepID=A0AAI8W0S3_9PEZI|nr:related to RNA binding LCP5 [Lecanosticta acicola]